jgi:hypothetical protein
MCKQGNSAITILPVLRSLGEGGWVYHLRYIANSEMSWLFFMCKQGTCPPKPWRRRMGYHLRYIANSEISWLFFYALFNVAQKMPSGKIFGGHLFY